MRDNRRAIQSQLREYAVFGREPAASRRSKAHSAAAQTEPAQLLFSRIINAESATIFLSNPRLWEKFDFANPHKPPLIDQWQYYSSNRGGDLLEVAAVAAREWQCFASGQRHPGSRGGAGTLSRNDARDDHPDGVVRCGRRRIFGFSRAAADSESQHRDAVDHRYRAASMLGFPTMRPATNSMSW